MPNSACSSGDAAAGIVVLGVALLHPHFSTSHTQAFTRLLSGARLPAAMLRPLLRAEVLAVAAAQAWHHTNLLTPQVRPPGGRF